MEAFRPSVTYIFQSTLMRNDKGRLGSAADDEIAQITVVLLRVTLARAEREPFLEQLSKGH